MNKRILIVEDDKFFRFAIKKYINWQEYGFELAGEAVHGVAALEFLAEHPIEIMITDMSMPIMNGIELTAAVKKRYPHIMIVALSAYDEFEFVKESLKLGAADYILKQDIENEDIGSLLQKLWQEHLQQVLKHEHGDVANYLPFLFESEYLYYLLVVENLQPEWQRSERNQARWFSESVLELQDRRRRTLILKVKKTPSVKRQREARYESVCKVEYLLREEQYLAVCSTFITQPNELQQCMQEVEAALEISRYRRDGKVLMWDEIAVAENHAPITFAVTEQRCQMILTLTAAETELAELTGRICQVMPPWDQAQAGYLSFISTVAKNIGYPVSNIVYAQMKEEISRCGRITELEPVVRNHLRKLFASGQKVKLHPGVIKGIQYRKTHYSQELSLGEIAAYVALNESYLSNLFKKETGKNITEYLNQIRIEKAKELIAETSYKNYEIAKSVGIWSASYFSTLFKKETGMTVQEYRQHTVQELT